MIEIFSGLQSGVDRGAVDAAIELGFPHGGYVPKGRRSEDGAIPVKYKVTELQSTSYVARTRKNIEDSDGTLVLRIWQSTPGTDLTITYLDNLKKPHYIRCLYPGDSESEQVEALVPGIVQWIKAWGFKRLNVAGPRETRAPGIQKLTHRIMREVLKAL